MKRKPILLCAALAPLAFAQPAYADGILTAKLAVQVVQYALKFLDSASSNTSAVAVSTAVSTSGSQTTNDRDTGYFWSEAKTTATHGDLAQQTSRAYADYNFLSPNLHIVETQPWTLRGPTGLAIEGFAQTKIKGVLQVLVETFAGPQIEFVNSPARFGELSVPVHFDFGLDGKSSYSFNVNLESETGDIIGIASGTAGVGGASLLLPYLSATNPTLAAAVQADYLARVSGQGAVSFTLGDGVLPDGADGTPAINVAYEIDKPFRLNSDFDGDRAAVIPEPTTWMMLFAGFWLIGGALRYRRTANTALR